MKLSFSWCSLTFILSLIYSFWQNIREEVKQDGSPAMTVIDHVNRAGSGGESKLELNQRLHMWYGINCQVMICALQ